MAPPAGGSAKAQAQSGPGGTQAATMPQSRSCSRAIAIAYIEGIVVYSSAARDYIQAVVPSGAAQEAHYPAGTLGDIQAVTGNLISVVLGLVTTE